MTRNGTEPRVRADATGRAARVLGVLIAAAFVTLLVYGVVAQAPDTGIDDTLARAEAPRAPGFELPVLHPGSLGNRLEPIADAAARDGRVALAELQGVPVVLNFWASWCIPCREEAPLLEREWQRARASGVLFVGLDMQDVTQDARDFLEEFQISYLNLRDKRKDVARRWGVTGIPETFFITPKGMIVGHVIGALTQDQVRRGIAAARSGRVVGALSGGARLPTR
jgi:cytochrome c biogenesis protein CcmG, thiol:disulfide interchange protein DsbE